MSDQQTIEQIQQEIVSANHDRLYKATLKEVANCKCTSCGFNKAKAIYKSSSGLDNISEFDMKKFNEIMCS